MQGPSKLVAAEDPAAYMPADLSAATFSLPPFRDTSSTTSSDNKDATGGNRAYEHGQENGHGNRTDSSALREIAYRKNLVALQDLRRVAEASEAKYIEARLQAVGNTAVADWSAKEAEAMRQQREEDGGEGSEAGTNASKQTTANPPAVPLSSSTTGSGKNRHAGSMDAKREELRAIQRDMAAVGESVKQLCAEKGRLQDIFVFRGDYDLKLQRQEFYMTKLRAALQQQHALLASNVALHLACVADVRRLGAATRLLLFVARQLAAVSQLAEHRQAGYGRVAGEVAEEGRIVAGILQGRCVGGEAGPRGTAAPPLTVEVGATAMAVSARQWQIGAARHP